MEGEWAAGRRFGRDAGSSLGVQALRPCHFSYGAIEVASKGYSIYQTWLPPQRLPGSKKRKLVLDEAVRRQFLSTHPLDIATTSRGPSASGAAMGRCERAAGQGRREESLTPVAGRKGTKGIVPELEPGL